MYELIRQLCKKKGISVHALEKELGFSQGSISKMRTSVPKVDRVMKIAKYFDVPVESFYKRLPQKQNPFEQKCKALAEMVQRTYGEDYSVTICGDGSFYISRKIKCDGQTADN